MRVQSLGQEDALEEGTATHSSIFARILEWIAVPFSRDLPDPRIKCKSPPLQAYSLPYEPPEKPTKINRYLYIL